MRALQSSARECFALRSKYHERRTFVSSDCLCLCPLVTGSTDGATVDRAVKWEDEMLASKVTRKTLESAAAEIGVTLDLSTLNTAGTRHRVKVNPGARDGERFESPSGRKGSPMSKYQRISASTFNGGRRVHAVCWHGFRDFFRAVYRREPGAVFKTAMDTWKGSEDFEARFRFSGHRNVGSHHRNVGSQVAPMAAAEACVCPSSGYAG